ncbi:MAG TPA: DUF892 family protein, partial [Pyrinomonadaceae bacterium]|nr:DUF892 family protein [Pyrinomonadaceae bacterium]
MNLDTLEKLYISELRDLYSAENQLLKALPKIKDRRSNQMKKFTLAVALALALVFSMVGSANAVTNGEPDAGHHPYVGLAVFDVLDEDGNQVP